MSAPTLPPRRSQREPSEPRATEESGSPDPAAAGEAGTADLAAAGEAGTADLAAAAEADTADLATAGEAGTGDLAAAAGPPTARVPPAALAPVTATPAAGNALTPSRSGPTANVVAALLWTVAIIPASMGFWLVAGSLAGVRPGQVHLLVVGCLLGLSIGTLLQVGFGYGLPIYEGPASAYLAAITVVVAEGRHGVAVIAGGLLAAGVFVAALGLLRADRLMSRAFTPLVANVFLLTVALAVTPATLRRAVGATHGWPGTGAAWAATLVVVIVALAMRRAARLTPYIMLVALLAGTGTYVALAGVPHVAVGGGVDLPGVLPWGAPRMSVGVLVPFLLAGALAAFNTVATGTVVAVSHDLPITRAAHRRAFVMHGAAQAGGALVGNVVGTVSRLDSVGIVRLLDHRGRAPLLLMAALVGALAFVRPVVDVAAALPLSVSAALLGVLLVLLIVQAVSAISRASRRVWVLVVVPSLMPTVVWIAIGDSLAPTVQLVANPMLWGVLLAMVLERLVARRAPAAVQRAAG